MMGIVITLFILIKIIPLLTLRDTDLPVPLLAKIRNKQGDLAMLVHKIAFLYVVYPRLNVVDIYTSLSF